MFHCFLHELLAECIGRGFTELSSDLFAMVTSTFLRSASNLKNSMLKKFSSSKYLRAD